MKDEWICRMIKLSAQRSEICIYARQKLSTLNREYVYSVAENLSPPKK